MIEYYKLKQAVLSQTVLSTSLVFFGSILSSGLTFVITTLLTQRMSTEEFGQYRLLIDTAALLFPLLLFGLQYTWNQSIASAYTIGDQERQKAAVLVLTCSIVLLTIVFARVFEPFSDVVDMGNLIVFIPFTFIICVPLFKDMLEGILVAQGKMLALTWSVVLPQALMIIIIFLLPMPVHVMPLAIVLVLINALFTLLSMILTGISFRSLRSTIFSILQSNLSIGFPIYLAGMVSLIGRNVLQLFTGARLDTVEYGNLSLAMLISGLLSLIPSAINKAKFKDFATSSVIGKKVMVGNIISMLAGAVALFAATYVYVLLIIGTEFVTVLQIVPVLLVANLFRGIGDLINRFFFAKGNASVLSGISLKVGGVTLVGGVILIWAFGIWGVVAQKVLESGVFFTLNYFEYLRFQKNVDAIPQ